MLKSDSIFEDTEANLPDSNPKEFSETYEFITAHRANCTVRK